MDYCEDKSRGIRYSNPRKAAEFVDATQPTVWLDGKVNFVLDEPDMTFDEALKSEHRMHGR